MDYFLTILLLLSGITAALSSSLYDKIQTSRRELQLTDDAPGDISVCQCDATFTRCIDDSVEIFQTMVAICIDSPDIGHIHNLKMTHADFQHEYVLDYLKFDTSLPHGQGTHYRQEQVPFVAERQIGQYIHHNGQRGTFHRVGAKMYIPRNRIYFLRRSWKSLVGEREMTIKGDVEVYTAVGSKIFVPFETRVSVQSFRLRPFLQDDDPWTCLLIASLVYAAYLIPRCLFYFAYDVHKRCRNRSRKAPHKSERESENHDRRVSREAEDGIVPAILNRAEEVLHHSATLGERFGVRHEDVVVVNKEFIQPTTILSSAYDDKKILKEDMREPEVLDPYDDV